MGIPAVAPSLGVTQVELLRSFQLRHDGEGVTLPPGAQRLIAFLALHRGTLQRVFVAGSLWIDSTQDAANANLRTALWRLRRVSYPLVSATATHLSLAPDVAVDLRVQTALAKRIVAGRDGCDRDELEAFLLAGELLPDWYDEWVIVERERFRQMRLHALEKLCDSLAREERYADAIEVGLAAVAGEPLRESAHRAVMRVHVAEGNRGEALRQYELCRRLLAGLGLEPSRDTQQLRRECAGGDDAVTVMGYSART